MNQKSWKSTAGMAVATVMLLLFFMQSGGFIVLPKWILGIVGFAMAGGFGYWGVNTKDADLTGGSRGTPSSLEAMSVANQMPAPTASSGAPLQTTAPQPLRWFDINAAVKPPAQNTAAAAAEDPPVPVLVTKLVPPSGGSVVPPDRATMLAAYKASISKIGVR